MPCSSRPTDIPTDVPTQDPTAAPTPCEDIYVNIVNASSADFPNLYESVYIGRYIVTDRGLSSETWQHETNPDITGSVDMSGAPGSDGYFHLYDAKYDI